MDSVSHVKSETKTQALGGFLWEELMGTISLQASTPPPQARSGSCCGWIWMLQTVENKTGPRPDCRRGVGGGWGKHFFQKKKKRKEKKMYENCLVRCQASEKSLPGWFAEENVPFRPIFPLPWSLLFSISDRGPPCLYRVLCCVQWTILTCQRCLSYSERKGRPEGSSCWCPFGPSTARLRQSLTRFEETTPFFLVLLSPKSLFLLLTFAFVKFHLSVRSRVEKKFFSFCK